MKRASYVSLQSALAYYGLIPEYVPYVTSVTTGRPETISSSIGNYIFKHIKTAWFHSYKKIELGAGLDGCTNRTLRLKISQGSLQPLPSLRARSALMKDSIPSSRTKQGAFLLSS